MATTMTKVASDKLLDAVATGDAPVLEQMLAMQMDSLERSGLDQREYMLTRIAALVASDAAPASYLMHLKAAADMGMDRDTIASVLVAIAPVVGTAKITEAVSHIVRAGLFGAEMQRKFSEMYG